MPMPKPGKNESQEKFMRRCMSMMQGEGRPQDQATAMCMTTWREHHKKDDDSDDSKKSYESSMLEGLTPF